MQTPLAQTHNIEDLNDLRMVAAIVETGTLSGTARLLGVNHATVFRRLEALEARIGVRLFEREGGRYHATLAGEELARAGAQIDETAAQALLKVAGRDLRPSGVVRITTTDSIARALLGPILLRCRQDYPQITLQVVIDNQTLNLSRRDADIAVRPVLSPPENLIGKLIAPLAFAIYGGRDYLAAAGDKPLAEHAWIALDEALGRHRTLTWLAKRKPLEEVGLRLSNFSAIRDACADGLGLAVLPCFLADGARKLKRVHAPLPECASEFWVLTHPDLRETQRVKVVYQLLLRELAAQAGRISSAAASR